MWAISMSKYLINVRNARRLSIFVAFSISVEKTNMFLCESESLTIVPLKRFTLLGLDYITIHWPGQTAHITKSMKNKGKQIGGKKWFVHLIDSLIKYRIVLLFKYVWFGKVVGKHCGAQRITKHFFIWHSSISFAVISLWMLLLLELYLKK